MSKIQTINCPFTETTFPVECERTNFLGYKLSTGEHTLKILLPQDYANWNTESLFKENRHILAGLLLNGRLSIEYNHEQFAKLEFEEIEQIFNESTYPDTPQEKYESLFLGIVNRQNFDGDTVYFMNPHAINQPFYFKKFFFKSAKEFYFYADTLHQDGLIHNTYAKDGNNNKSAVSTQVTFKGLSYAVKLENEGRQSNNCFIAMSFGDTMGDVRAVIKQACIDTGYTPIIVDEVHYDSDSTINDAIIANLKKSRFCIADFTEQKKGVYFESGFALGQGKQVIYSCRNDSFKESHFDTNHFPHILYDTPEELKQMLINKIEAWIR